jgi:hypothetical protein
MKRFVEGEDRTQGVLLPEFLNDYVGEDNPVWAIDVFVASWICGGWGLRASWWRRQAVRPTIPRRCKDMSAFAQHQSHASTSDSRSAAPRALPLKLRERGCRCHSASWRF